MSKLILGKNDLYTMCKINGMSDVLESWDAERNAPLTPKDVSFRSGKRAYWICKICGNCWESKVATRTNGHGCPNCGQKRALELGHIKRVENNNFLVNHPEYAKEWNYAKNGNLRPDNFSSSSKTKVWWICENGHEWYQSINSRTGNKTKCPVCNRSGRVRKGINDFAALFPQYLSEWDYEKNDLQPSDYRASSADSVWWKCNKGHSWKQTILSRTRNLESKCPICTNRVLLKGYNDLQTQFPELLKEWDYENNNLSPSDIKINSNEKVLWICAKCGNHFSQRVLDRTSKHTGCPICGLSKARGNFQKAIVLQRGSLAETNPELAKEWDYEKNKGLTPDLISSGSNKKVWWRCKYGHSFCSLISNRKRGAGCPICNLKSTTSFPEQCVYFYVKKAFLDAQNGYKLNRKVYDIFIPSQNVAIEYDGYKWHQDERDTKNDIIKNKICIEKGIRLFRIREVGASIISGEGITIIPCQYNDEKSLEKAIQTLLESLGQDTFISIDNDRKEIQEKYLSSIDEQSLQKTYPQIAKEWDFEQNNPIRPDMVHFGTRQKYWWKCAKGHTWQAQVCSRTRNGTGCPVCSGKRILPGYNDLLTLQPELANEWNYVKNTDISIDEVSDRSNKSVWWKCSKCGYEWKTRVIRRVGGNGCPVCYRKNKTLEACKLIEVGGITRNAVNNSLWEEDQELAGQWNYEKNIDLKPWEVTATSIEKVWWTCNKGHAWEAQIWTRYKKHSGCPYCSNKLVLKGYNDFESCRPEIAKEWNYEKNNPLKPSEVTCGSNKTVWWRCSKCGYEWTTRVSRRASGTKCPKCKK